MIFKTAYKNGNYHSLKVLLDNGEEKWMNTDAKVYSFAKNNFQDGDECDVQYEVNNEKYKATRITKKGGSAPANQGGGKNCQDCGAKLKNPKYDKCYACNQKNPAPKKGGRGYGRSPEELESIKKQAILKASADAIKTMTGQFDSPDTLADAIITVFDKLYAKLSQ
jgi:hypothetical protein